MNNQEKKKKPFYKKWWVWVIAVFFISVIASLGGEDPSSVPEATQNTTPLIEYSVLREWNPDDDSSAIGFELLIKQEDVSKDNIIALIQSIGSGTDKAVVKIYKTLDAWEAEKNETYGDIYNQGYLAFYVKNTTGSGAYRGFNEIRWMQEIGELKDLFSTKTQISN